MEPSPSSLTRLRCSPPHPLSYAVAIDPSGQARGRLQGAGRAVPASCIPPSGSFLWYHRRQRRRVAVAGEPVRADPRRARPARTLGADGRVCEGAARVARPATGGTPQPGRFGCSAPSGRSWLAYPSLRGYPGVNLWASAARLPAGVPLSADASAKYGRKSPPRADTEDQATSPLLVLAGYRVAYPSHQATTEHPARSPPLRASPRRSSSTARESSPPCTPDRTRRRHALP